MNYIQYADRDNMIEFDETDNVRVKDLPEDYVSGL